MAKEQRKHPRVSIGTGVRYRAIPAEVSTLAYIEGVLENVGLGGIFITTESPLPRGSLVEVEFQIRDEKGENSIRAQAVVRWDRKLFTPRGMGLEFVEFEGLSKKHLESWLQKT